MQKGTIQDRFCGTIAKILEDHPELTKTQIATDLECGRTKLSEILAGRMMAGTDVIAQLCQKYEISPDWILCGRGPQWKSEIPTEVPPKSSLPLIPIEAVAGFNGIDEPGISFAECPVYAVPEFIAAKAEYMIRVSGSSMYPKYSNGDILACRRIPEITFIQWGKVYVIDSMQGAMVKRLFEIDDNPDELLCKSDNENYPPFRIPRSEIRSLSIVLGVVRLE